MKVKVHGKQELKGISKKTSKPYHFTVVHCSFLKNGVAGRCVKEFFLDAVTYPQETIVIDKEYNAEFDNNGYLLTFDIV